MVITTVGHLWIYLDKMQNSSSSVLILDCVCKCLWIQDLQGMGQVLPAALLNQEPGRLVWKQLHLGVARDENSRRSGWTMGLKQVKAKAFPSPIHPHPTVSSLALEAAAEGARWGLVAFYCHGCHSTPVNCYPNGEDSLWKRTVQKRGDKINEIIAGPRTLQVPALTARLCNSFSATGAADLKASPIRPAGPCRQEISLTLENRKGIKRG